MKIFGESYPVAMLSDLQFDSISHIFPDPQTSLATRRSVSCSPI